MNKKGEEIQIKEERITAEEYVDFLKRTDLGSQYPKERFEERIAKPVCNVAISLVARNASGLIVGVLFGLLKRGEKVFVTVVPDCSKESLMPVIKGLILESSTIYTDGWKAYDGLILNGYEHHRVFHSENEFARGKSHVNGIENFWSFAKRIGLPHYK